MLVATVIQGLLVEVGEQLHALEAARGGLSAHGTDSRRGALPVPRGWPGPHPAGTQTHSGERSPGRSAPSAQESSADTAELSQVPGHTGR